jgi:DnaK suppressor protein
VVTVSRHARDESIHDRRDHDVRALAARGTCAFDRPDRLPGAQTDTSPHQELIVKEAHARDNVARERARIEASLTGLDGDIRAAGSLRGQQTGELEEGASGLETESVDVALAASLRAELAAVGRAEERMTGGTYGRSVQSGLPIPDERLAVEPLAERTVEEQALHEASGLR